MRTPSAPPKLIPIAAPIFFELLLAIGVGLVGTWLAARLGDPHAAAFAVANNIGATLFILFRIVGAGVSVVVAQNLGADDRAGAKRVALAALAASSWVGVFSATVALTCAYPLLLLMNTPREILPLAQPFLMALSVGLLFDAWNATAAAVLRANLRVRDTLITFCALNIVQIVLAFVLMPRIGLVGYAIAVAASRGLALAMQLAFWRYRMQLVPQWHNWWRLTAVDIRPVLHIGLPGAAENIAYRLAFMVSLMVAGHYGAGALATQAYTLQISYVVLMFGLATGLGVEIVVGHMVGARALKPAYLLVRRALVMGLVASVLIATGAARWGHRLVGLFTSDPAIAALAGTLLWWAVLLEPGRTFNLVVINALRAAGDARFPVLAGAGSMIVVLAGGAWFLGVTLGMGLVGVWVAYAADEWVRGLIMWWRWQSLGWVPHARAARRRARVVR